MTTWLTIDSSNLDISCGGTNLTRALDGTSFWQHDATETHWFILDLKDIYTLTRARARSITGRDPIDVDIYTSIDKINWIKVADNITTWQDTAIWVEVALIESQARYVKIEIIATEDKLGNYIIWGRELVSFTIIDLGFDVSPPRDPVGTGWEMVSIKGITNYNKADLQVLYNGTYYTWAQATSNDNEEGEPLLLAFIYGWDYTNQYYTNATVIDPAKGYWVYWYHHGALYVDVGAGGSIELASIVCIPSKSISLS